MRKWKGQEGGTVESERRNNMKIDFVIAWVDGSDPAWQKEKNKYMGIDETEAGEVRFRDMGILKYWFRAVDAYAPWVNQIHFVTWGHLPEWLNTEHPKLHIVNHKDYIPEQYLPTFSSRPIELNLHRIPGLSEQFVYFNDDMFLNGPVTADFFFHNGMPCDFANLTNIYCEGSDDAFAHVLFNEVHLVSKHFSYLRAFLKHPDKYLNLAYSWKANLKNLLKLENHTLFSGFEKYHLAAPYLKQTFVDFWTQEHKTFDRVSRAKFRTPFDVGQRVFRYWQLASGQFHPVSPLSRGKFMRITDPIDCVEAVLNDPNVKMVCINDTAHDIDFVKATAQIAGVYNKKLPNKSSFEK